MVKRISTLLLTSVLAFLMLSLSGCKKYGEIKVDSVAVESLTMNGFRAANLVLLVGVDNPAGKVEFKEIAGSIKHSGKVLGNVTVAPMVLTPKSRMDYKVPALVELAEGVKVYELMKLMDMKVLGECTVDVSARIKAAGIKLKKEYKDIPVKELLEGYNDEKI